MKIVVKIGSSAITKEEGGIDEKKMRNIVADLLDLIPEHQIIMVTSGAIHTGKKFLKPGTNIDYLQACSAVGQPLLIKEYSYLFKPQMVARILVTHEDFGNRKRHLNTRNTINYLLNNNIIPILNENDTVSFDEITVGDNDQLASMTAVAVQADLLVILSSPDGVYAEDPTNAKTEVKKFDRIGYNEKLDLSTQKKSTAGRGGMKTKLSSAYIATSQGIPVVIGTYKIQNPVSRLLNQKNGTYFEAKSIKVTKFKAWINSTMKPKASIYVDKGASEALLKNASLLPAGIRCVEGLFKRGDCVKIVHKNQVIALGLSEYDSKDVKKIVGKHSSVIEKILTNVTSSVVVHRDNLVLKD